MKERTLAVIGAPIILVASRTDLARHQRLPTAVGSLFVFFGMCDPVEFGRRSQGAVVVYDVFFAVISEFKVVLLQEVECLFSSLQVVGTAKLPRHRVCTR